MYNYFSGLLLHRVWLPNDLANQDEILMFVKEFMDLDIPVGTGYV